MQSTDITRSPFTIKHNTLPESHLGQWLSEKFLLEFRVKPAYDTEFIMVEACPAFIILDADTKTEIYRFQTGSTFSFSGFHSKSYIRGLIHHLINIAIHEFNEALQKTKSFLAFNRNFDRLTIEEIEPYLNEALKNDLPEKLGIIPYWKNRISKTVQENEDAILRLPPIPKSKHFLENSITKERIAINDCITNPSPSQDNIEIINKVIEFYKASFYHLKQIDLRNLTDNQCEKLKVYLKYVLNITPFVSNDITIPYIYRATVIKDEWLENGKIKNSKYLTYPPVQLNKKRGIYNRANSPNATIFYACEFPNVAIREIRPDVGKIIILSTWAHRSAKPLIAFPLCLTAGLQNEYADRNNYVFEKIVENSSPIVAEWIECFFSFFAYEFIKDIEAIHPKRYDYLYSAFFSDCLLQPFPEDSKYPSFDCIVYPSVAWNHIPNNFAILPEAVDRNFTLFETKEYEILNTWYDKQIEISQFPAALKLIRHSVNIEGNIIKWNDD